LSDIHLYIKKHIQDWVDRRSGKGNAVDIAGIFERALIKEMEADPDEIELKIALLDVERQKLIEMKTEHDKVKIEREVQEKKRTEILKTVAVNEQKTRNQNIAKRTETLFIDAIRYGKMKEAEVYYARLTDMDISLNLDGLGDIVKKSVTDFIESRGKVHA